ncbi:MAG: hypothetical protein WA634_19495 [Silvibacterium sp.]
MQGHGFDAFLNWGHGAGFAVYFIALWSLVCYGISWMGGWHRLAGQYRCEREFDGERWRFRSGLMRWCTSYRSVLTLGANRDGLYLAVFFLFRLGHPPLFIPWSEITASERRRWFMSGTQFVLGRETQIPLWVFKRVGDGILEYRPADSSAMQDFYSRPGLDEPRAIE